MRCCKPACALPRSSGRCTLAGKTFLPMASMTQGSPFHDICLFPTADARPCRCMPAACHDHAAPTSAIVMRMSGLMIFNADLQL